jgi:AcrR family transcriptional regulator
VSPVNRRAEATAPIARRPPGRPRNTDSGDTRQRVLDAAIDVFAEHGFDGASSKAIAMRAGVTPATIYHHFGNKRGLYEAAYRRSIDVAWAAFAAAAESGDSLVSEVMAVVHEATRIMATRPTMTVLAIRAEPDRVQNPIEFPSVQDVFAAITERAVARGEIAVADAPLVAPILEMFLWGISVVGRSDAKMRDRCERALAGVLDGTLIRRV